MVDLTDYLWIVWLVIILIFVIIELLTLEFTFLMLAFGSLGGLGAELLDAPWWLQIIVASGVAVLLILTIRPLLLRLLRRDADPAPSNIAALMGLRGRVVSPIGDTGGLVKLANGETWTARIDPEIPLLIIALDESITVSRIEGSTAIVVPTERNIL